MNVNTTNLHKKREKSFFERYGFHGQNLSGLTGIPHLRKWLAWIENKKNAKSAMFSTASYFLSEVSDTATALDFGCGGGWAMIYILTRKPSAFVVGIDLARTPMERGKKDAERFGFKRCCEFVVCDCTRAPFRESVFDASIDLNVIHHLSGVQEGLGGIYHVLKKGGYALLLEVVTNNPFVLIGRNSNSLLTLPYSSGTELGFTSNEMERSLSSIGFKILRKGYDDYFLGALIKLAVRYPKITVIFPKPILLLLIYLDLLLQRLPVLQRSGGQVLFMCQK